MSLNRSFQAILDEKMQDLEREESNFEAIHPSYDSYEVPTWSQIRFKFQSQPVHDFVKAKYEQHMQEEARKQETKTETPIPEPLSKAKPISAEEEIDSSPKIKIKNLGTEYQFALEILLRMGATGLGSQDLSLKQLKKCYRKLAKTYHPDTAKDSHSAQDFYRLKQSYDLLLDAFDELS